MSVCVVTKSHSLSRNLMNVVPRFEIHFEMHELRPILDHDLPIVPFDFCPSNVVVTSFR